MPTPRVALSETWLAANFLYSPTVTTVNQMSCHVSDSVCNSVCARSGRQTCPQYCPHTCCCCSCKIAAAVFLLSHAHIRMHMHKPQPERRVSTHAVVGNNSMHQVYPVMHTSLVAVRSRAAASNVYISVVCECPSICSTHTDRRQCSSSAQASIVKSRSIRSTPYKLLCTQYIQSKARMLMPIACVQQSSRSEIWI
jgi:arginyl-tRNA--protein-N-Asp/Glu arginylyltransferase